MDPILFRFQITAEFIVESVNKLLVLSVQCGLLHYYTNVGQMEQRRIFRNGNLANKRGLYYTAHSFNTSQKNGTTNCKVYLRLIAVVDSGVSGAREHLDKPSARRPLNPDHGGMYALSIRDGTCVRKGECRLT